MWAFERDETGMVTGMVWVETVRNRRDCRGCEHYWASYGTHWCTRWRVGEWRICALGTATPAPDWCPLGPNIEVPAEWGEGERRDDG